MTKRFITFTQKTMMTVAACALLTACQTAGTANNPNSSYQYGSKIDSALQRAASNAAASGHSKQSLAYLEKIYKRNSSDPQAAIEYAAGLREADYLQQANMVLTPFADDSKATGDVKREYAALQLALGNYDLSEQYAQQAILMNEEDALAYQYLGISLDAREMHEEAERAFRKGLDHWKGDPTNIMNNLALNLASQGFFQEAIEILRKAQSVSPHRIEIERNLRIVTALQQSEGGWVPKPKSRPER